jgi:hypothetical protein
MASNDIYPEKTGANTVHLSGWLMVDEICNVIADPRQKPETSIFARLHTRLPRSDGNQKLGGYSLLVTGQAATRLFAFAKQGTNEIPQVVVHGRLLRTRPLERMEMVVRVTYLDILNDL